MARLLRYNFVAAVQSRSNFRSDFANMSHKFETEKTDCILNGC